MKRNAQPTLFHNPDRRTPITRPVKKSTKANASSVKADGKGSTPTKNGATTTASADDASSSLLTSSASFQEFKLMSCNKHGWKYDVMKFDSRRSVDISTWTKPVRLNRKELRREPSSGENTEVNTPKAVAPMLGLDGKPVIGIDGRVVMVDAEGRPIHNNQNAAPSGSSTKTQADKATDKSTPSKNKKKFQKKTRQVFLVPDHIRQLRREERYPWVMEDSDVPQKEVWVGRMEEASKSETHALFMPAADNVFKFVPANRWYKFQKRTTRGASSLEEAEKLMAQIQKQKDPEFWLMHKRNGQASSASLATIRGQTVSSGSSLVHNVGHSLGPGGRRLRTVDAGDRGLFEEDDEEGVDGELKRRRDRERGQEGDLDEMEYEEDFADDDDKMEPEGINDEETKEIEERLKREYRNANKTREGYIDESEEEDEGEHLTGAGKAMKKLMRKVDGGAYESDDDKNPYASSEEDEEEPQPEITQTQALQQEQEQLKKLQQAQQAQQDAGSRAGSQAPSRPPGQSPTRPSSKAPSRTGSPSPTVMGTPPVTGGSMGGHSVVAKRATSPKAPAPKLKAKPGSRATSPLAGVGSRASSPVPPSAGVAAVPGTLNSHVGSPPVTSGSSTSTPKPAAVKRKADDASPSGTATPAGQPKPKKRKPTGTSSSTSPISTPITASTQLTRELLVQWLENTPNATTRDCIQYFQPCLTDESKKLGFTRMVKELAHLKSGTLVLKPGIGSSS